MELSEVTEADEWVLLIYRKWMMKEWRVLPRFVLSDEEHRGFLNQNTGERAAAKDKCPLRHSKPCAFAYVQKRVEQVVENMTLSSGERLGLAINI